ncbi:MAG: hypothetical protein OHK0046_45070 [Anaerolineae bacterium]
MRFNGCAMQLAIIGFFGTTIVTIIILALLGPAIGNVFSNIVTELDGDTSALPTMAIIVTVSPPTESPIIVVTPTPTLSPTATP